MQAQTPTALVVEDDAALRMLVRVNLELEGFAVEEASTLGWGRFVGPEGATIGMHTFGSSAPLKDVQTKFGFTPDRVAETAKEVLGR